ncbi:MAG: hypothetical protein PHO65_06835 [Sulfurovum sp.]|nr:hypothetical protein [Sulfurovum sp.]
MVMRSVGKFFFEKYFSDKSVVIQRKLKLFTIHYSLFTLANANEQNLTAQLRDIKPLLEIPDYSFYLYWGLIGFFALLGFGIFFFTVKKFWENRKVNLAKMYLERLKQIDWKDSKHAAYEATKYARLLATDERRKELFSQLEPMLEQYKYKKVVEEVDQQTLNQFHLFVRIADESI